MIPWLAKSDQSKVFPNNMTFDTPEEQEKVGAAGQPCLEGECGMWGQQQRGAPARCEAWAMVAAMQQVERVCCWHANAVPDPSLCRL